MNCFFCSAEGVPAAAIGICIDCGCAACERHGAVEIVLISVRTGNMFEERPAQARRFRCAACRSLLAQDSDRRVPTGAAAS